MSELSQPTYAPNLVGKIVVDKAPEGAKSPNLADAVVIRYAPVTRPMSINPLAIQKMGAMGMRR
jgi:phage terminase large subunit